MELFSSSWLYGILANIVLLVLISIPLVYFYSQYRFSYWKRKGIKGPPTLPFIGNFLHPTRPIPLMQMDNLRQYGHFFGYIFLCLYFQR